MLSKVYWKDKLAGYAPKTNYFHQKSQGIKGYAKGTITYPLNTETFEKLETISGGNDSKSLVIGLAAMGIMVRQYTGEDDIVIGVLPNRALEDTYEEPGIWNHCLPLRVQLNSQMGMKTLLNTVKNNYGEALNHFDALGAKVIQSIFSQHHDAAFDPLEVVLTYRTVRTEELLDTVKPNLILCFDFDAAHGRIEVQFNKAVYTQETVERLLRRFEAVLSGMLGNLSQEIKALKVLPDSEKDTILKAFNASCSMNIVPETVHSLFEQQAALTPEGIAVIDQKGHYTYAELNQKAEQIARELTRRGLRKEEIAGVLAPASFEASAAFFGILKAGGAFLPLDPKYPVERLNFMIQDSGARMILTLEEFKDLVPKGLEAMDLNQALDLEEVVQGPNTPELNQLAYIIYTSGTTGDPKGVMIDHQAFAKTMLWRKQYYDFQNQDRVLVTVSSSFDGFNSGFYAPLISGAGVVLPCHEEVRDLNRLAQYIETEKITHLHGVPALMTVLVESIANKETPCLKALTVGGEKPSPNLIETCNRKHIKIYNEYGPTENTIITTCFEGLTDPTDISVGQPIYDTEVYVLDSEGDLCPLGVAGEIYIGGGRLAKGYLNNSELTHTKFICSSLSGQGLLYKTGDIGYWNENGSLYVMGRIDDQVKINGYRIEIGDIESKMMTLPRVSEVAVLVKQGASGENYLCAYCVQSKEQTEPLNLDVLAEALSQKLPAYMVPQKIIEINSLPRAATGKTDRKKLAEINEGAQPKAAYVKPRNQDEAKMAAVFETVLGAKMSVGIHDNFFTLGGDSIKAIRCASLLSDDFALTINDLYKHQTIAELSVSVNRAEHTLAQKLNWVKMNFSQSSPKEKIANSGQMNYYKSELEKYAAKIGDYETLDLGRIKTYQNILLTGVTGYVGAYLLKELLERFKSDVYVLVRGRDANDSLSRLVEKLTFYFGSSFYKQYAQRIHILNGDIARPGLGLTIQQYSQLSQTVDCIVHSAAYVKHYGNEQDFEQINVVGTRQLLDFAQEGRLKDFNHISTTSVSEGLLEDHEIKLFSEFDMDMGQQTSNLYAMSKLASEKLVEKAAQKGLKTKIFRLGNVSFDSQSGRFQENIEDNAVCSTVKSFYKLNAFPKISDATLNFSYVDQLAKAVVLLMDKEALEKEVFHIYNPSLVSLETLGERIRGTLGRVELLELPGFLEHLEKSLEDENQRDFIDKIIMYFNFDGNQTDMRTTNEKTEMLLKKLGFQWPEFNEAMTSKMFSYWRECKFI